MKNIQKVMLLVTCIFLAPTVFADTAFLNAKIVRVLSNDGSKYGGCMAQLTVTPKNELPSCGPYWVTFSCNGEHVEKEYAYSMFDTAKMALALDMDVYIEFTDVKGNDGFCFAYRIDALNGHSIQ